VEQVDVVAEIHAFHGILFEEHQHLVFRGDRFPDPVRKLPYGQFVGMGILTFDGLPVFFG
jgi:hypothetical protein